MQSKDEARALIHAGLGLPDENHIRVLNFHSAKTLDESIVADLAVCNFESEDYEALSYSWGMDADGDATLTRQILINGQTIQITQNLFEGLLRVRSQRAPLRLWVDAICINQDDMLERSEQVAKMAAIYANAIRVLVWLGEGHPDEDLAMFEYLDRLSQHREVSAWSNTYNLCVIDALLPNNGLGCPCTQYDLEGQCLIVNLVKQIRPRYINDDARVAEVNRRVRGWVSFFKSWIIQELVHSREQIWLWGAHLWKVDIRGNWLRIAEEAFARTSHALGLVYGHRTIRGQIWPLIGKEMEALVATRKERIESHRSLLEVLERYPLSDCTDPRDRLYALSNTCEPKLTPDYTLTFPIIYINFGRTLLSDAWGGHRLLRMLQAQDKSFDRCKDLPSWVPDLRLPLGTAIATRARARHQPRAMVVLKDDSLLCQTRCVGVFQQTQDADRPSLCLVPWTKHEAVKTGSGEEESSCFTIAFNDGVNNAHKAVPSDVATGDVLVSLTEEWHLLDILLILRPVKPNTSVYVIVHPFTCYEWVGTCPTIPAGHPDAKGYTG